MLALASPIFPPRPLPHLPPAEDGVDGTIQGLGGSYTKRKAGAAKRHHQVTVRSATSMLQPLQVLGGPEALKPVSSLPSAGPSCCFTWAGRTVSALRFATAVNDIR